MATKIESARLCITMIDPISHHFAYVCEYLPLRDIARLAQCSRATNVAIAPLMETREDMIDENYIYLEAIYVAKIMPRLARTVGIIVKIEYDGIKSVFDITRDSIIEFDYREYRLYAKCTRGMTSSCICTYANNFHEGGREFQFTNPVKLVAAFNAAICGCRHNGFWLHKCEISNQPNIYVTWECVYWKSRNRQKKYLREHLR